MSSPTIIDTDSHVIEPSDLWTSRLPKSWGDDVMHVRWSDTLDAEAWFIGETEISPAWVMCTYKAERDFPVSARTKAEVHPANYEVAERVKLMDRSGVRAAVLYPNIAGLGIDPFVKSPDLAVSVAHVKAYNDFVLEFSGEAPGRFIPMACIPYWSLDLALKEVERAAGLGHSGLVMTGAPHLHGQPRLLSPHWNPLWEVCQAAGLSGRFHASNGGQTDKLDPELMEVEGVPAWVARETTNQFLYNTILLTTTSRRIALT